MENQNNRTAEVQNIREQKAEQQKAESRKTENPSIPRSDFLTLNGEP